jgi:hypothetical protein
MFDRFVRLTDFLAEVLYWTGCFVALLVVGVGIWMMAFNSAGFGVFIICAVIAALSWATGWVCRWALTGRT